MKRRLALASTLRRRLGPTVLAAGLLVAGAAPTASFVAERAQLVGQSRERAESIASLVRDEVATRPTLWRYDAGKLAERLVAEGLGKARVVIHDADGRDVNLDGVSSSAMAQPVWGHAPVIVDEQRAADVWVAADARPLVARALRLALVFALLGALLGALLYALPSAALRAAETRIERLVGELMLTLQEEDRRRIARDLHDGAGQALTAARLELAALRKQGLVEEAKATRLLGLVDEALDEVRRSVGALAPSALAELGLLAAIERQCALVADAAHLEVERQLPPSLPALAPHAETACYRIVQEALTNVARHAAARRAIVRVAVEGEQLVIDVRDDGTGAATGAEAAARGHGIEGIRERARLLGGAATISARPGGGQQLAIRLPLTHVEEAA